MVSSDGAFGGLNRRSVLSLLEFFCRHPGKSFYVREAAREAGASVGSCNAALKTLAGEGFFKESRRGNQLHYSLDATNPAVRQFRVFLNVLALGGVVDSVKGDCEKIVLYGSRAAGEEAEDSDFDVLFVTNVPEAVRNKLSRRKFLKLSPLVVDAARLVALRSKDRPFYDRVMSGIELWRRRDGER